MQVAYLLLSSFEGINLSKKILSGNDGEEATPVPIPNTEVKLFSADGSWGFPPVRVGRCQARRRSAEELVFFLCLFKLVTEGRSTEASSGRAQIILKMPKPGEGEARRSRK